MKRVFVFSAVAAAVAALLLPATDGRAFESIYKLAPVSGPLVGAAVIAAAGNYFAAKPSLNIVAALSLAASVWIAYLCIQVVNGLNAFAPDMFNLNLGFTAALVSMVVAAISFAIKSKVPVEA